MKKKTAKKLVLAKETLCMLESADLQKVAGGTAVPSCPEECTTSYYCPPHHG